MNGLFIPEITTEMFRNGCLESIEALMAEGEIYDIEYSRWIPCSERLPDRVPNSRCSEDVLIHNGSDMRVGYFVRDKSIDSDLGLWITYDDNHPFDFEPIAWMPLPTPQNKSEILTWAEGSEE